MTDNEHRLYEKYVRDTVEIFALAKREGKPEIMDFLEWMKDRVKMRCPSCCRIQYTSRKAMEIPYEVKLIEGDCVECDYTNCGVEDYVYREYYYDRFGEEIFLD